VESHRSRVVPVLKSFLEKPNGSKVMETKLSRVSARTEIRFLIRLGGGDKNIVSRQKLSRGERRTKMMHWQGGTIANDDRGINRRWGRRGKDTRIVHHVRACTHVHDPITAAIVLTRWGNTMQCHHEPM
jgi:hypothetical protein